MLDGIIAAAEDIDVRECAMWHPNMTEDHLEAIADNDAYNEEVRVAALSVLGIRANMVHCLVEQCDDALDKLGCLRGEVRRSATHQN